MAQEIINIEQITLPNVELGQFPNRENQSTEEDTEEYDVAINLEEGGEVRVEWNVEDGFRYYRNTEPGKHIYVGVEPKEKYPEGEKIDKFINLSAYPKRGWRFEKWTGDHEGTQREVFLDPSNIEVTSHFKRELEILESNMEKEEGEIKVTGTLKHTLAVDERDNKRVTVRARLFNEEGVKLGEGTTNIKRIGPNAKHKFKITFINFPFPPYALTTSSWISDL